MLSRHLTVPCSQCGRAAAEIALLPGSEQGESLLHEHDRLERTDFIGMLTQTGEYTDLLALFEAIARADYAKARAIDPDLVAFCCKKCERVYCDQCWQLDPPEFEDGFYDCTRGTCPQGHQQIVDD